MNKFGSFPVVLFMTIVLWGCQSIREDSPIPTVPTVAPQSGHPEISNEELETDTGQLVVTDELHVEINRWLSEMNPIERDALRNVCQSKRGGCVRAIADQSWRNDRVFTTAGVLEIYRRMRL